jgi:hypothetical protein
LVELCDQAVREVSGASHRMPSGPLHAAAEVSRAGIPTVMMFIQSLRGISHKKIEGARGDHLEMSVVVLDRLPTKAANWILRQQKRSIANHWVIATTNIAEAFFQWTRQKRKQRPAPCQTRTEQAAQEVFRMASRLKNTSYDRQPAIHS